MDLRFGTAVRHPSCDVAGDWRSAGKLTFPEATEANIILVVTHRFEVSCRSGARVPAIGIAQRTAAAAAVRRYESKRGSS